MHPSDEAQEPIRLRPLIAGDQDFLWDALYHAIHVASGQEPLPREIIHDPALAIYAQGWLLRSGDLGWLAEAGHTPVGAAWLRRWTCQPPHAPRGFGFLDTDTPELSMAVLPGWRGRGIGTRLLRAVMDEATKSDDGVDRVSLSVDRTNPALRLYLREGFVPIDPRALDRPIDPAAWPHDSLTMVRDLAENAAD